MPHCRKILRFLLISIGLAGGFSFPGNAQTEGTPGFVVDKIITKVDNYIVLKSELEASYQNYLTQGNVQSGEAKCRILSGLILDKLMVAKAEIDSVVVTDDDVDQNTSQRMNAILQSSGNSGEELERMYGKSLDQIKVELRDQVREQLIGRAMQNNITKDISVTPSEVKRFFNKIPSDSLPFYYSDVEVAQIVSVAQVSNSQKEEAKRKLSEIRQRILDGENFNELAKKYSQEPAAQMSGGELGYNGRGAMVFQFEKVAYALKKGEISQPFESPFGFHIMQLLDRRGSEYNSRHILIAATPSKDDIKRAERYLDSLRMLILKDSIKFEKAALEYSEDQNTKGHGGFFTDPQGGTRISIKDLEPYVYFVLDTMKLGGISPPVTYRTDDQKEAVRILYFKTKLPPHEGNLKDDWTRMQSAALAEKKDKALEKWFSKARLDVFINIDPDYKHCNIIQ
jgi:peptidyl-prolyl cis-trans isomerase SurA